MGRKCSAWKEFDLEPENFGWEENLSEPWGEGVLVLTRVQTTFENSAKYSAEFQVTFQPNLTSLSKVQFWLREAFKRKTRKYIGL